MDSSNGKRPAGSDGERQAGPGARASAPWRWPKADTGADMPEIVPGILQEHTDAYAVPPAPASPARGEPLSRHRSHPGSGGPAHSAPPDPERPVFYSEKGHAAHPAAGEGTGNLKHVLQTGLPPGVDFDDVSDPGTKARAAAMNETGKDPRNPARH